MTENRTCPSPLHTLTHTHLYIHHPHTISYRKWWSTLKLVPAFWYFLLSWPFIPWYQWSRNGGKIASDQSQAVSVKPPTVSAYESCDVQDIVDMSHFKILSALYISHILPGCTTLLLFSSIPVSIWASFPSIVCPLFSITLLCSVIPYAALINSPDSKSLPESISLIKVQLAIRFKSGIFLSLCKTDLIHNIIIRVTNSNILKIFMLTEKPGFLYLCYEMAIYCNADIF